MPRRPRIHLAGGIYHAILCGNHRHSIFYQNADRTHRGMSGRGFIRSTGQAMTARKCWLVSVVEFLCAGRRKAEGATLFHPSVPGMGLN